MSGKRISIFVEDPGAANFIFPVLPDLEKAHWRIDLTAAGAAVPFLADRGIATSKFPPNINALNYLETTGTDIVMVGTSENPYTLAFALTEAAKKFNIPSIGFVDGPANTEHRFRGTSTTPLEHVTDWLILADQNAADKFRLLCHPDDKMIITGHPYYDKVLTEAAQFRAIKTSEHRRLILPTAPLDKPVIVFLGEGSDGFGMDIKRKSPAYTLVGWGNGHRRTEIVLEEFLDAVDTLSCRPYLVFRAHPRDQLPLYKNYLGRFDEISQGGAPLQLLFAATLTVGLSTSLLVEASLAKLNTLSILPTASQKYLIPTVAEGLTPCVTSRESLLRVLPALMQNRNELELPTNIPCSKRASARIVDAINMVAQTGRSP